LKASFEVEKSRLDSIISAISTRLSEDAKPILEIGPEGLIGYDKSTGQSYSFVRTNAGFFAKPPESETKFIVTKGLMFGLKQMTSGNIVFKIIEAGTDMFKVYIEGAASKGIEKNVFHDNLVIPVGDELGFPKEIGKFSDNVLEIKMESARVCVVDVEAIKLQELTTSGVERFSSTWYPDDKVTFVLKAEGGATVEKTFSVTYLMKPEAEFSIDFEPKAFNALVGNMLGKIRLSLHKKDSGEAAGVVLTQSASDHDIGYTLSAMNPI
jgi:hypothetical protein